MDAALRWTSADLEVMPDDGKRYEIIDGELYVSKPTQYQHQLPCTRIVGDLNDWGLETKLGVAVCGVRVIFAEDDDVIPDAVWISRDRLNRILGSDGYFHAAPDLAIEVLSPGDAHEKRDREVKRKLYSRRGVLEYWIINWQVNDITVYRRKEKALRKHSIFRGSDILTSPLLPGFQCAVKSLFANRVSVGNKFEENGTKG